MTPTADELAVNARTLTRGRGATRDPGIPSLGLVTTAPLPYAMNAAHAPGSGITCGSAPPPDTLVPEATPPEYDVRPVGNLGPKRAGRTRVFHVGRRARGRSARTA